MKRLAGLILTSLMLCSCSEADQTTSIPPDEPSVRVATFNIAMGLNEEGAMATALATSDDSRLKQIAAILQRVRPDVVLLNEFDYQQGIQAAMLLNQNYLSVSQGKQQPIEYPYHFAGSVNTGLDSGVDLDGNGRKGEPGDAFGFGTFPGQYGMLVLSRYPIDQDGVRTFQNFLWSSLQEANRPVTPDGIPYYPDDVWNQLRLSSKSHWDVPIAIDGKVLHLLAYHPTPPVFDGAEDRNGRRNFDEHRFWLEYIQPDSNRVMIDDSGTIGNLHPSQSFIIAGDFNADPFDGDSIRGAVNQLLDSPQINSDCVPTSEGAREASMVQGGVNQAHRGDPSADTSDFNDERAGNLRLDYLLPAAGLDIKGCGVFWPANGLDGAEWVEVSDHRLVWLDLSL